MKLLTLNTHSLQGEDPRRNLERFVQAALEFRPDVIALQEVNQLRTAAPMDAAGRQGYVLARGNIPLRRGNYAGEAARLLRAAGVSCCWTWLPAKLGYGKFDEGLALLSLSGTIAETDALLLSARDDYTDWRTRKALGIRLEGMPDWFYSVHLGWWGDEDPFRDQWARLEAGAAEKRARGPVWLLGDFNAPAHIKGQSRDLIASSGWRDTYEAAAEKDSGVTVEGAIDGWRDKADSEAPDGMRIDYIWCSDAQSVKRSRVVLNGTAAVSDHFGVLAETEETR